MRCCFTINPLFYDITKSNLEISINRDEFAISLNRISNITKLI